jgi:hypothetical protein
MYHDGGICEGCERTKALDRPEANLLNSKRPSAPIHSSNWPNKKIVLLFART